MVEILKDRKETNLLLVKFEDLSSNPITATSVESLTKSVGSTQYSPKHNEAINLKITDIDKYNKTVFIKNGKGKKDRYAVLSDKILKFLREYYVTLHTVPKYICLKTS